MKIVLVNAHLQCGGAERVVVNLANHWTEEGDDVSIVTFDRGEEAFSPLHDAIRRVPLLRGLPKSIAWYLTRKMVVLYRLRSFLQQHKPDVVITFQEETNIITRCVSLGLRFTHIISVRNHPRFRKLSRIFACLRPFVYARADALVVQTQEIAECFRNYTVPCHVIPNPVIHYGNSAAVLSLQRPSVVAIGRLVKQKRFDRIVEAMHGIEDTRWTLYIVGDGPERTALQAQIDQYALDERVVLVGETRDVRPYLEQADIVVCSSEYEGFPNALCEALMYGLCVLSVDCPSGPRDIIDNDRNGVLIPRGDEAQLGEYLERLMNDPEKRMQLSEAAPASMQRFSIQQVSNQWRALF